MNYEQMFEYLGMNDVQVSLITCKNCGYKFKFARFKEDTEIRDLCKKCRN